MGVYIIKHVIFVLFYVFVLICCVQYRLCINVSYIRNSNVVMQEGQLNLLRAPMPGVVKSIACEVGDLVEEGTTIVVLEAMKMQNPLFAPMTGKVCMLILTVVLLHTVLVHILARI